jgi:hypothetical protein
VRERARRPLGFFVFGCFNSVKVASGSDFASASASGST